MDFITSEIGYVKLLYKWGSDESIAEDAGMSTGVSIKDENHVERRIKFLMNQKHESVFEHGGLHVEVKAPLFVTRQWLRHRVSSTTERSGRYTVLNEIYIPPYVSEEIARMMSYSYKLSFRTYNSLIKHYDVKYEVARMVLPVSTMTNFVWSVNLRS